MAEEIKKEEISTKINESKIRKLREPDFSKEVVIDRIQLMPKQVFDQHFDMMKKTFPTPQALFGDEKEAQERAAGFKRAFPRVTDEQALNRIYEDEINRRINSLCIRDAVFNQAMKIIVPCYEIKIDQKDIENFADLLRKVQPNLINAPKNYVELMARRTIEKELIFIVLAKEWNITVTDDDAKKVLMNYYKATNESVREKLNDQSELDKIKSTLMEQTIANKICSLLKYKLDMEAITKHAQEDKQRAAEFFKQAQAEAEKTKKENPQPAKPEEKK